MMGLNDAPYWLSWLCFYTIQNTMTSLIAWLTMSINLFPNSNQFLIFLMIWCYGMSIFGEIVMIQALFTKSKYAGIMATVVYFLFAFVNLVFLGGGFSQLAVTLFCIIPQVCIY